MARLIAPNGSTVNVSDKTAERLLAAGYKPAEEKSTKTTRKASSAKSEK